MTNAVLTKDQTPTLDFADVSDALAYWVQVAADRRFTTISAQSAALATSTFTPSSNLTDAKKYFWRFRTRTTAAYTTDQNQNTGGGGSIQLRDDAARTGLAQGFKPDYSMPLARVNLNVWKTLGGATGNIWVEIWTDSSGSPSAQTGTDSALVDISTFSTSDTSTFTSFDFATPIPLVAGTQYYIVLQGDYAIGAAAGVAVWAIASSNVYSDGGPFKHNAAVTWSTNGTSDHVFQTFFQAWGAWSPIWSFWLDTTFDVAVTPTAWTLVDPAETTDAYTFAVMPNYVITPQHVQRSFERNLAGDLLTDYAAMREMIDLDFSNAYVLYSQMSEMIRFYDKRKAVFLIVLQDNRQDTVENVYKVEFDEEAPQFAPIASGRQDLYAGQFRVLEAAIT